MKKIIAVLLVLLTLSACGGSGKENNVPQKKEISFEVEFENGKKAQFTLDPDDAVSYQELRDNVIETSISSSNWRSYFDIKEVYREHYEYDEQFNKTVSYMAGNVIMAVLNDEYVFVDNWSRNGLEWQIFIDGEETRIMTNNGKTYDPSTRVYQEIVDFSGADPMLIMTDFVNSWDETTKEEYTGHLNNYEMVSCQGDVKLLKSSVIKYKKLTDDIYYFAAYDNDENFFVIFVESNDDNIQREDEYNTVIYATNSYGEISSSSKSYNLPIWEAYVDLMKKVNES